MAWQWSKSTNRYRDTVTGRFIPRTSVLGWVADSLSGSKNAVTALAEMADPDNPILSPGDWRNAMREQIKGEYLRQYMLGRGGRDQMGPVDWGSIGGSLAEQYKWLDSFAADVEAGNLSEAQIRARAQMYIDSAREAYERGYQRAELATGVDEVRWRLDAAAENCPDCIAFDAMGWQKITDDPYNGCVPGSGCTVCLVACKCSLEYRSSSNE